MENDKNLELEKDNQTLWTEGQWITDMELVRTGKCQPNKCGSACCKFHMIKKTDNTDDYIDGFYDSKNEHGDHLLVRNCKHLDVKNNKCKVWGTDKMPEVCKQFPVPTDAVYKHVFDVCTFKFEMRPIKKAK